MAIDQTFFTIENQRNVLFFPERPNGFAVLIIGDHAKSVEENTSIWHQHPERHQFITSLINQGYTIFTSELFGAHWGNQRAVDYIEQLYHLVYKKALLNKRIHVVSENSGALVSLSLMKRRPDFFRSAFFINPCLSLEVYEKQEKQNKLYYKRFRKEIAQAYGINEDQTDVSEVFNTIDLENMICPPMQIVHDVTNKRFPFEQHSRPFSIACERVGKKASISLHGNGKNYSSYVAPILRFFKKHEEKL
ncbi:alpha/beta hydrolase [Bacillus sp. FJAT-45037]|uniref:alpha/beta hydrolase n=1 Tax=Bacillus sp. FJAT-45037 TaxID=2011007 RepID=UPI000C24DEDB|nr:alpha/beta hydrolase [Bacillus sp. FJAT-45037]